MKRAALLLIAASAVLAGCGSEQKAAEPQGAQGNGRIIYSISQGGGGDPLFERCPGLWTVSPEGTDLVLIGPDDTFYPTVSPDGRKVAVLIEGELWVVDLTSGAIRRLMKSFNPASIYFFPYFTWLPGSDALLLTRAVRGHDEIARIDVPSGEVKTLLRAGKEELAYPMASPDGSRIAYTQFTERSAEVWLMAADGRSRHKLVEKAHSPVWTPDGKRITFFRSDTIFEESPLMTVDTTGKNEQELTHALAASPSSIRWSPDGDSLLFIRKAMKAITPYGEEDVYRLELSGDKESVAARNANLAGWAPSGDRILYTRQFPPHGDFERIGIYTATPDGKDEQLLGVQDAEDVNIHSDPVWQPDSGKLVPPSELAGDPSVKKCVTLLERARERAPR